MHAEPIAGNDEHWDRHSEPDAEPHADAEPQQDAVTAPDPVNDWISDSFAVQLGLALPDADSGADALDHAEPDDDTKRNAEHEQHWHAVSGDDNEWHGHAVGDADPKQDFDPQPDAEPNTLAQRLRNTDVISGSKWLWLGDAFRNGDAVKLWHSQHL